MLERTEDPQPGSKDLETGPAILLIAAVACLILIGLGRVAFWDDEAHVALFGRSLVATHSNCAWDGRNLMPDHSGAGLDANLVNLMPQLDNYAAALSFALFGDSPWSARLPFALCGIAAILLFWRLLLIEFPGLRSLQLYALITGAFSAPLLLYFRSCRYYGLSVLLTMGILVLYRRFLQSRRLSQAVMIGVLGGLLSLSSILNCACLAVGLAVRHLLFHRREFGTRDWLKTGVAGLIASTVAIPYALTCVRPAMERAQQYGSAMKYPSEPPCWQAWLELLWRNLVGLNLANAIPWSLGLCLLGLLVWKHPKESPPAMARRTLLEMLAMLVGFLVILSAVTPQSVTLSSIADVRYFTPMLLVIAILMGAVFWWISLRSRLLAPCLLAVYLSCNLLSMFSLQSPFKWLLPGYVYEIFSPYPTACSETCAFLRANAKQDDTVWYFPDFMGKPLLYYVGDKIKLRGTLDRNTILPKEAIAKLPPDIFIENLFPNWAIAFGRSNEVQMTVRAFSRVVPGTGTAYRYSLVKVVDVYWDQTQRPEILWHNFGPWRGFDKQRESVFIFKRSEAPIRQGVQ